MKDIIFYRCVARESGEIFVFYCNCLQGAVCANPCPAGTFGDNCLEKCECYNSASCHHQTGRCECPPGYRGELVRNESPLVTCIFIPSSPSSSLSKDYLCWIRT